MSARFAPVRHADALLAPSCRDLDPEDYTPQEAARLIEDLDRIVRRVTGAQVRMARRIDESIAGGEGEGSRARWLAKHTGQSPKDAEKDIAASEKLVELEATDEALRNGELSPTQAHEVIAGAGADPTAELELLDTAKNVSVPELKRKAKKVRAAATNAEEKAKRAHEHRDFHAGTDEDEGEGWFHGKGRATTIAELLALLEPWVQAEFDKARRAGRRERRGALMFDALLTALRYAAVCRNAEVTGRGADGAPASGPVGPPVTILGRVDVTALLRGATVAGEVCEIDGLGPVSAPARAVVPPATSRSITASTGLTPSSPSSERWTGCVGPAIVARPTRAGPSSRAPAGDPWFPRTTPPTRRCQRTAQPRCGLTAADPKNADLCHPARRPLHLDDPTRPALARGRPGWSSDRR